MAMVCDKLQQCTDVSLQDGYFSKFGIPHEVCRYNSEDATEYEKQQKWLCMGQNTWETLMWPLREMTFEDFSGVYYFLNPCFYLRSASFFGVLRRTFYFNQFQFATLALSNYFFV